ncbi:phospholipase A and acyltransferase 4-like [Limanda limanda]|uniref:phospholipase A and acyltransferase 4-like n=1 Tax=Limanda limanda TaxID=27771 RepID=UPI0029C7490C|nr:phospholipase A and acyltransferase 4-like [Limanda limanda]
MLSEFKGNEGDLIEISHRGHKQWAIYIGVNEVVMLVKKGDQSPGWLESLSSSTGKVKLEKLAAVVGNHRCQVNNLLDNRRKACQPSVIVKKAREMVGRNLPYNVASYNSKHFATEIRYGEAESWLVKKTSLIASITGAIVALVTEGSVVAVGFAVVGALAVCKALIRRCSSR